VSDIRGQHDAARPRYRVSSLSGDHIDDVDVAGYALGALEPAERQVIEHHIRTCQTCADRISRDVRTVGMLPFALAGKLKPAPDVKASLFARIAHSQQAAADALLPTRQPVAAMSPTLTIPSSRPATRLNSRDPADSTVPKPVALRASRSSWFTVLVAAPLLLTLVLVGGWSLQLRSQLTAQESALSAQASELNNLRTSLANFGSGDAQAEAYQLQPGAGAPQAEGQFVLSPDQTDAIIRVDLNSPRMGGSARILVNNNGTIEPLGEVTLDERGMGEAIVSFDEPLTQGQSIQIEAVPTDPSVSDSSLVLLSGTVSGMNDPGLGANAAP
jgi:hypothetical protein